MALVLEKRARVRRLGEPEDSNQTPRDLSKYFVWREKDLDHAVERAKSAKDMFQSLTTWTLNPRNLQDVELRQILLGDPLIRRCFDKASQKTQPEAQPQPPE